MGKIIIFFLLCSITGNAGESTKPNFPQKMAKDEATVIYNSLNVSMNKLSERFSPNGVSFKQHKDDDGVISSLIMFPDAYSFASHDKEWRKNTLVMIGTIIEMMKGTEQSLRHINDIIDDRGILLCLYNKKFESTKEIKGNLILERCKRDDALVALLKLQDLYKQLYSPKDKLKN